MAQKTTAHFEHFTELIIIKCNVTTYLTKGSGADFGAQ